MKKTILSLIVILFFFGCSNEKIQFTEEKCPKVMISKEHKNYIYSDESEINLDNISLKSEINNFSFNKPCLKTEDSLQGTISILFVIKKNISNLKKIKLPFYIASVNSDDKLMDIQYYSTKDIIFNEKFKKDELEIVEKINLSIKDQSIKNKNGNYLIIGFMLSEDKLEILN